MTAIPSHGQRILRRSRKGAALFAAALALQACTVSGPTGGVPEAATETEAMLDSTATLPELSVQSPAVAATTPLVPVYWLGKANGLLYREFLPAESSGDPIAAAIWAMTSAAPLDGDYYSPWQEASSVNTSISPDNVITVDISSDTFAPRISADLAGRAIQQLVYTATAAAANSGLIASGSPSSVRLLVDGKAGYDAFGHIELGSVLQRDVSLIAPVWIINPQEGALRSDRTVIIEGSTTSTEPTLQWRVRRIDGGGVPAEDVVGGSVPRQPGTGTVSLYEFSVTLEPGTYLVEVYEAPGVPASAADDKLISIQ